MAGVRHHSERYGGQHGAQQCEVVVAEARRQVGGKRIANTGAAGRVPARAEADDLSEIIGSAGGGQLLKNGIIKLCLGAGEAATQITPGIRLRSGVFQLADQIAEGAVLQDLLVLVAAAKLRGLDGIEVAAPGVAVAAPLRMQSRHADKRAPQRHSSDHQALTETVEKRSGGCAAKSFAHHPHV